MDCTEQYLQVAKHEEYLEQARSPTELKKRNTSGGSVREADKGIQALRDRGMDRVCGQPHYPKQA